MGAHDPTHRATAFLADARHDLDGEGPPAADGAAALPSLMPEALAIAQSLALWLVRSGIGHAEFAAALKPVFLSQAQAEAERLGQKPTDSTLSLLSGLHRKDVRQLRALATRTASEVRSNGTRWGRPGPANQVVTRWLTLDWPDTLPFTGPEPSFEALVRRVSTDFHHRAVLQEMVRLGVAAEMAGGKVRLMREAFMPNPGLKEARQLFAGSVGDHLAAGVHNLTAASPQRFLEQSVFADGLSAASVQQLNQLANQLWSQALEQMVAAAVPLCERDAQAAHTQRFRLGMFTFSAPDDAGDTATPTQDDAS